MPKKTLTDRFLAGARAANYFDTTVRGLCFRVTPAGAKIRSLDMTCGQHGWRWERAGVTHPAPVSKERVALDAIAAAMSDSAWNAETGDRVAAIVRGTGRRISEVH